MADPLQDVIQRWREAVVEEGLRPEDHELFQNTGLTCINQGDTAKLVDFIQDKNNQMTFIRTSLQIPSYLWTRIFRQIILSSGIAATVLVWLGDENSSWVGLVLVALQKQVSRLPVPYTKEQGVEDAYSLCSCCSALARFVEPFLEEVKRRDNGKDGGTASDNQQKTELLKLPRYQPSGSLSQASCSTRLCTEAQESQACLAYLLFVQLITIENFPAVFRKDESFLLKGLELYTKSLERVEDNSLQVELLDLKSFYSVPQPGNGSEWFVGTQVLPLLSLVLCFPWGPETDMLNIMDS
ncbi:unnamed protein product [Coregonus sp. 'balchen']|nr:unnamed protein product [Coregonus sp. 'balchen']